MIRVKGYKAPFLQIVNNEAESPVEEEEAFVLFLNSLLVGKTPEEVQKLRALYRVAYEKALRKVRPDNGDFFNCGGI